MLNQPLQDLLELALLQREKTQTKEREEPERQHRLARSEADEEWLSVCLMVEKMLPTLFPWMPPCPEGFCADTRQVVVQFDFPEALAPIRIRLEKKPARDTSTRLDWFQTPFNSTPLRLFAIPGWSIWYHEDGRPSLREGSAVETVYTATLEEALLAAYDTDQYRLAFLHKQEAPLQDIAPLKD